ncbi:MAG: NAD(P)/FAD-dependent oxidoreductase, partial [Clostridia bacterium]|nr:NAD(P)/FAD-dependent oxidoreductase [Clostridia bacterium]
MARKVVIIGAGPAGMTAAGKLAEAGCNVTLFERNNLLGKKLGITGKGRCNV